MLNLLRHLDRTRFEPSVALLRPGPLADDLREINVPVSLLAAHRMRNVPAVWRAVGGIKQIVHEQGIDLVHSNGFRAHVYGGIAAWQAGIPALWLTHTAEKPGLSTSAILRIPAARVIANCPRTAEFFVAHGHATSMIWPSVDPQRLANFTARGELAARFGLPTGARWVCMGARLQRYKGHEFFLRALASLPPAMNDVRGVVIGGALFGLEQGYLDELKDLAKKLGVGERVCFTGFVPDADVHGFLAASELLLHPALDEDFGLIVAEAQAMGRPVLAFASVGPAAIIEERRTGRLVPPGDQAAMNSALVEMIAQPEMVRPWGEVGRESTIRRFGVKSAVQQLERAYNACLRTRSRVS